MYDSAEKKKELSIDRRKTACITAAALLTISLLIVTSSTVNLDQSQAFAKEHSYESVNTAKRVQAVNETMDSASPGLSNSNSGGNPTLSNNSNNTTKISRELASSGVPSTTPTPAASSERTTLESSSSLDRETMRSISTTTPGTITTPSTIGLDGSDFTTQAAISSLTARPTNNIVNTNSFYDVVFLTASSGAIKTIQVTFPAGTTIPSGAFFNEAEGIGPGTASKSGQTISYTVTNAVNVPFGTKIRLEFANINNPLQVSASYTVTVTTRDAANAIIDGPSQSTAYTIKKIGTNAIADNSITSSKPNQGFMKKVILSDNAAGNALGWNPDGVEIHFTIFPAPGVTGAANNFIAVMTSQSVTEGSPSNCDVISDSLFPQGFILLCDHPPINGAELQYLSIHVPNQNVF